MNQAHGSQPSVDGPDRIMQLTWGFAPPQILNTALELDVFTHVAAGRNSPGALQQATGAAPRGLDMLLDALVALGFLTKGSEQLVMSEAVAEIRDGKRRVVHRATTPGPTATRLQNAADVDRFLVRGRDTYLGDFVQLHVRRLHEGWRQLTQCVRTGRPVEAVERPQAGVPLWHELVDTLFPLNHAAATALARELKRLHPAAALRVLDVAAGSGVWGLASAQLDPTTHVVAFDLPETLPHVRAAAQRLALTDQVELRGGDLREASLGEREFDVVILGHICHSEGAEHTQALLRQTARALVHGGTLAIAEFLPDDDRRGPPLPLMFALNMLVHTTDGNTFTVAQFRSWLEQCGFADVRTLEVPAPSPLILATRS
ncbi:MAG: methyltransferase [Planctomycetota bacterium]